MRWRWNRNTDTPLPPEEPAGQNPPDGAILDYVLKDASGPVTLEIVDAKGQLVRKYSSEDKPEVTEAELERELHVPTYWVRPTRILSAEAGMHRFVWDLRYAPPKSLEHQYPISAIYRNTPREPRGALVLPGRYSVKLTVAGVVYTQPLKVVMDPRVQTTPAGLEQQLNAARELQRLMDADYEAVTRMRNADASNKQLKDLTSLNRQLAHVFEVIEGSDNAPTTQALAAVKQLKAKMEAEAK